MTENIDILKPHQPTWRDVLKSVVFIGIAIGVAYWVTVSVGIDTVRENVATAGIYGPLIIILLKATTIVVVPLGGTPLYPIAGAIFGFWQGLGITLIGDAIGATIAFYLSRYFGVSILHFFISRQHLPMIEKIVERVSQPKTFWKARLFFAGFPELFAYAAGLTKVSYLTFIFAYLSVHALGAALLVLFGEALVTGNILAFVAVGVVSTLLAAAGVWWFHADLKQAN